MATPLNDTVSYINRHPTQRTHFYLQYHHFIRGPQECFIQDRSHNSQGIHPSIHRLQSPHLAHSSIMGATIFTVSFKQVRIKKGKYCFLPHTNIDKMNEPKPHFHHLSHIVSLKDGIHTWNVQSNNRRDVEIKNAFYELLILQQMILSSNSNTPPTLKTL